MAISFDVWTVLKHEPIEKHADNFWTVKGTLGKNRSRVMSLARLQDGRVVVHNAVALDEPEMQQLEAWGKPSFLVVPGGFHRQDARIWKQRYPQITVLCPRGAKKNVEKALPVDGHYADLPSDPNVTLVELASFKGAEGYLQVNAVNGASLVVNDAICNIPKSYGPTGLMMGPTGKPSVPRVIRLMFVRDKAAAKRELETMAAVPNLRRVVLAHGPWLTDDPAQQLREVARLL